mmetsp:Transcript_24474/g.40962  ORF Transcript_24474/g.40962 Transcript_24474/m.40962 type:complete len:284 (-) Transcript_24474:464-1315(-)
MEVAVVPVIVLPPEGCGKDALACRHVGFFAVTNHSVPDGVIGAAWEATRAFFDAPAEEKMRVGMPYKGYPYGYSGLCSEALSNSQGSCSPPDLEETFSIRPNASPKVQRRQEHAWGGIGCRGGSHEVCLRSDAVAPVPPLPAARAGGLLRGDAAAGRVSDVSHGHSAVPPPVLLRAAHRPPHQRAALRQLPRAQRRTRAREAARRGPQRLRQHHHSPRRGPPRGAGDLHCCDQQRVAARAGGGWRLYCERRRPDGEMDQRPMVVNLAPRGAAQPRSLSRSPPV